MCERKGLPVIPIQDVTVTGNIKLGHMVGFVCEAQWTKPDGTKVCCSFTIMHFALAGRIFHFGPYGENLLLLLLLLLLLFFSGKSVSSLWHK